MTSDEKAFWDTAAVSALQGVLAAGARPVNQSYELAAGDAATFADHLVEERSKREKAEKEPKKDSANATPVTSTYENDPMPVEHHGREEHHAGAIKKK